MARWNYIAQRLNGDGTGTFLDYDLPLSGVSLTDVLSGPNALTASITPAVKRLLGPDGEPIIQPWSTALYAEQDGVIRSGCIVTDCPRQGPNFGITALGFTGYAKGIPYIDSSFWIEADPLNLVRAIWNHIQSQRRGNLGLQIADTTSPVRIGTELKQVEFDTQEGPVSFESGPYKLNWWQTDDLGKEIDALAESTPFDYLERHVWKADHSDIDHFVDLGYPSIGARKKLRFVLGENIDLPPNVDIAGGAYADELYVLGAGEGRTMIRGSDFRSSEKRLRRPAIVTDKQLRSISDANSRARKELALRLGRGQITEVSVTNHPHAPIGSFRPGDEILLQGEDAWGNFEMWVRVLSITTTPQDAERARMAVRRTDMIAA